MSGRGRYEDVTTLLYIVPFAVSVLYALGLWVQSGVSLLLPTSAYLTVTRDPTVFIVGSLAIMLGVMVEVNGTEPALRQAKLFSLGGVLQSIAIASLLLAAAGALYANGLNPVGAANDFMVGRYDLVFPAIMVLLSYLLTVRIPLSSLRDRKVLAIIALLLVPASLYEVGRRSTALGFGAALVLLAVGSLVFVFPQKPPRQQEA